MAASSLLTDTVRALGFLSRLPLPARHFEGHDGAMGRTSRAFPIAGLVVSLPAAVLLFVALSLKIDAMLAALLALALQTILTGALHEDGFADTLDGLGGARTKDRALEIMKDSRLGSYGAIGLILSFGLRLAALVALARVADPLGVACLWLGVAAASRAAMVWHWSALPPARPGGVAAGVGSPEPDALFFALATGAALGLILAGYGMGPLPALSSLAVMAGVAILLTRWIDRRLGGHTGDTIGFHQQAAEIACLAALALWA